MRSSGLEYGHLAAFAVKAKTETLTVVKKE